MEISKEIKDKLIWLFLLSPGFISISITGQIIDLGQLTEFQITYYSLVLTVVNLAVAMSFLWLWGLVRKLWSKETAAWTAARLLTVGVTVSVVLGAALGLAAERDMFFVTFRSLPITDTLNKRSSSRPVPFLLSQNSRGRLMSDGDARPQKVTDAWILVVLKNDRKYEGWPEFYGLGKERSELYLSPACEYKGKEPREQIQQIAGPGVILYEDEIRAITLLDRKSSQCFLKWFPQKPKP